MNYRRMGKSGLKLSELSLGAWITYGGQVDVETALDCMKAAYDQGVNFFDNAEAYAAGKAEIVMGNAFKKLGWRRESFVVSTKIFWGGQGQNESGLSYKHIVEGMNNALERLQLEYVDLVFCHRPDSQTPIEETVWAMDQVIRQGKAFYWGTSEWSAAEIMHADGIARKNGLRPPSMEQPQYNMFCRERFEVEYRPIFRDLGYGTTIWSPLRSSLEDLAWLKQASYKESEIQKANELQLISDELDCTMAQLALAWCLKNPDVSTVITGASKVGQIHENMKALEIVPKLTDDIMEKIEDILDNKPHYTENWR